VVALSLREPRFADLRGVKLTVTAGGVEFDLGSLIPLIARLASVPEATIDMLTMTDVQAAVAAVLPLLSLSAAPPPPPQPAPAS
jgi:hypothetical protein